MKLNRLYAWAQVAVGCTVAGLVVVCVHNDIVNNYEFGTGTSPEMAYALAAFGAAVLIIPFAAGITAWSRLYALAFGVCVAVSMLASASAYIERQGAQFVALKAKADAYKAAQADENAARSTIAAITETGTAEALGAVEKAKKAALDGERAKAAEITGNDAAMACQQRKACREADAAYQAAVERRSQAEARDAAQAKLEKAKQAASAGNATPSRTAEFLGSVTGASIDKAAQALEVAKALFVIVGTQIVAALGHEAARLIANGFGVIFGRREISKRAPITKAKQDQKQKGGRKAVITQTQALEILRKQAAQCGGQIIASGAAIAAQLGVSRSTVCDPVKGWLAVWTKAGHITIEKAGRNTVLKIKRAA